MRERMKERDSVFAKGRLLCERKDPGRENGRARMLQCCSGSGRAYSSRVDATIVGQPRAMALGMAPSTQPPPTNPGLLEAFIYVLPIVSSLAPTAAPHHSTSDALCVYTTPSPSTIDHQPSAMAMASLPQPRATIPRLLASRNPLSSSRSSHTHMQPAVHWRLRFDCHGLCLLQPKPLQAASSFGSDGRTSPHAGGCVTWTAAPGPVQPYAHIRAHNTTPI